MAGAFVSSQNIFGSTKVALRADRPVKCVPRLPTVVVDFKVCMSHVRVNELLRLTQKGDNFSCSSCANKKKHHQHHKSKQLH